MSILAPAAQQPSVSFPDVYRCVALRRWGACVFPLRSVGLWHFLDCWYSTSWSMSKDEMSKDERPSWSPSVVGALSRGFHIAAVAVTFSQHTDFCRCANCLAVTRRSHPGQRQWAGTTAMLLTPRGLVFRRFHFLTLRNPCFLCGSCLPLSLCLLSVFIADKEKNLLMVEKEKIKKPGRGSGRRGHRWPREPLTLRVLSRQGCVEVMGAVDQGSCCSVHSSLLGVSRFLRALLVAAEFGGRRFLVRRLSQLFSL